MPRADGFVVSMSVNQRSSLSRLRVTNETALGPFEYASKPLTRLPTNAVKGISALRQGQRPTLNGSHWTSALLTSDCLLNTPSHPVQRARMLMSGYQGLPCGDEACAYQQGRGAAALVTHSIRCSWESVGRTQGRRKATHLMVESCSRPLAKSSCQIRSAYQSPSAHRTCGHQRLSRQPHPALTHMTYRPSLPSPSTFLCQLHSCL
jgi:hypothetical protein